MPLFGVAELIILALLAFLFLGPARLVDFSRLFAKPEAAPAPRSTEQDAPPPTTGASALAEAPPSLDRDAAPVSPAASAPAAKAGRPRFCIECGASTGHSGRFCIHCGSPIDSAG